MAAAAKASIATVTLPAVVISRAAAVGSATTATVDTLSSSSSSSSPAISTTTSKIPQHHNQFRNSINNNIITNRQRAVWSNTSTTDDLGTVPAAGFQLSPYQQHQQQQQEFLSDLIETLQYMTSPQTPIPLDDPYGVAAEFAMFGPTQQSLFDDETFFGSAGLFSAASAASAAAAVSSAVVPLASSLNSTASAAGAAPPAASIVLGAGAARKPSTIDPSSIFVPRSSVNGTNNAGNSVPALQSPPISPKQLESLFSPYQFSMTDVQSKSFASDLSSLSALPPAAPSVPSPKLSSSGRPAAAAGTHAVPLKRLQTPRPRTAGASRYGGFSPSSVHGSKSPSSTASGASGALSAYASASAAEPLTPEFALAQSPDLTHIISSRGIILYAAPCAALGLTPETAAAVVGRNISELCHPRDHVTLMRELKECENGASFSAAYRFRKVLGPEYGTHNSVLAAASHSPAPDTSDDADPRYVWMAVTGRKHVIGNGKRTKCFVLAGRIRQAPESFDALEAIARSAAAAAASTANRPPVALAVVVVVLAAAAAVPAVAGLILHVLAPSSRRVFGDHPAAHPDALYAASLADCVLPEDRPALDALLKDDLAGASGQQRSATLSIVQRWCDGAASAASVQAENYCKRETAENDAEDDRLRRPTSPPVLSVARAVFTVIPSPAAAAAAPATPSASPSSSSSSPSSFAAAPTRAVPLYLSVSLLPSSTSDVDTRNRGHTPHDQLHHRHHANQQQQPPPQAAAADPAQVPGARTDILMCEHTQLRLWNQKLAAELAALGGCGVTRGEAAEKTLAGPMDLDPGGETVIFSV
ncbi:hypothetical protein DFJ73DRAFT_950286 [Zopfochytrium polystomum]|nr:hypothetical protein DFJ73DRAFT_950286 [Zopfochytrium polystomum]